MKINQFNSTTQQEQKQVMTTSRVALYIGKNNPDLYTKDVMVKGEPWKLVLGQFIDNAEGNAQCIPSLVVREANGTKYEETDENLGIAPIKKGDTVRLYMKEEDYARVNAAMKDTKVATLIISHKEILPATLGLDLSDGTQRVDFFNITMWPSTVNMETSVLRLGAPEHPLVEDFREQQQREREERAQSTRESSPTPSPAPSPAQYAPVPSYTVR